MRGAVCVPGGLFMMSRMIFLCVRTSGLMYIFVVSAVPHMEMLEIRWGYMCVR